MSTEIVAKKDRELEVARSSEVPAIFVAAGRRASLRFLEFFAANIRNLNTRRAYLIACTDFFRWCQGRKFSLEQIGPMHVAAYIELLMKTHSKPTVKQHLAAIRMLFDWLVTGQVVPTNPAHSVRGPKHSVKKGKTPVLNADEARVLLDSIPVEQEDKKTGRTVPLLIGLRDRALIALMTYTFARVGAATSMKVEDYYQQGHRFWIRLHEKGGKRHEMPAHHNLDAYLSAYIDVAGLAEERHTPLFRSVLRKTQLLTENRMSRSDVYRMIRRRAAAAGIKTLIGCHTFRATGITAYLKNGGKLELAQQMANHESARTTGLYDRRGDEISLDEVERIVI